MRKAGFGVLRALLLMCVSGCAGLLGPAPGDRLELDGALNFRDIGGYRTTSGDRVVRGLVYRSDALNGISDADRERLNELGIRTVVDLRSLPERDSARDRVPQSAQFLRQVRVGQPSLSPALQLREVAAGRMTAAQVDAAISAEYRELAAEPDRKLGTVIDILSSRARLPAIVHCNNGRDRTGASVALMLLALGVPREQVVADFLRSNEHLAQRADEKLAAIPDDRREALRPLYSVKPAYIEAFIDEIDERWGSVEDFIHRGLGVDAASLDRFRGNLTE